MSIKSVAAQLFAKRVFKKTQSWATNPIATQKAVFEDLIKTATKTEFGKDHHFDKIKSYEDFANQVPVRDYEGLKSYVEKVVKGQPDILWKG